MNLGPVQNAVDAIREFSGNAATAAKGAVQWLSRQVVWLSGKIGEGAQQAWKLLSQLIHFLWETMRPHLNKLVAYLQSPPGIFVTSAIAAGLALKKALSEDWEGEEFKVKRYALGVLGLGFAAVSGAMGTVVFV